MSHKSRILIVDDNPLGRENLGDLLTAQGYELAFAHDGFEALAQTAVFDPDLILLDVMMPGMDGFEVCRRLRHDPATAELPIIMVTALTDRQSRLQGIEAGVDDFISKPFDNVELRARVQAITRLNRYRRLLAERTKFEITVEHTETGYLLINNQDQILFANPVAAMYLTLLEPHSPPVAETFLSLVRRQYRCEPEAAWAAWPDWSPENMVRYLVRPETAVAQTFWLQVKMLGHLPLGTEPVWIVSLNDVTMQMASQRDRRQFHSIIAHKLRTPLNNIRNSLDLVTTYAEELPRVQIVELSTMALEAAERLHRDLKEVIGFVSAAGLAGAGSGFDPDRLPAMITQICAQMGIQSVTVTGVEDVEAGVRAALSTQAMEVVLWEILENAKKFHPQQQPVVEVSIAYENGREVTIRVSDDGLTLSPEQLTQVWTPYYQAEKYFTGQVEGMGLGLPMVASSVWSVDGRCRIFNRAHGPGVTVELGLPSSQVVNKEQENNG